MGRTNPRVSLAARPGAARRLRVVVVGPASTARAGVAMLIDAQPDMEIVGQAGDGDAGLQAVRRLRRRSDVIVVVSISLRGEHDAFWLIRQVRERCPEYAIVATGVMPARVAISRALFVGADGYLDVTAEPAAFLDGIRRAGDGSVVFAGLPSAYLGEVAVGIELQDEGPPLTERERGVLCVGAGGLTDRQIAAR